MKEKRWVIKPEGNSERIDIISKSLNTSKAISSILVQRGIHSFQSAKKFFRPSLDDLYDPYLLKDMDKTVNRLVKAIDNDENILVYGDYDVDGSTSVAMMYHFLNSLSKNIFYYIPDRYKEGYGISMQGIEYAKKNKIDLLISLDCGIREVETVQYATEQGIDIIITDHHEPGNILPNAYAIVNPKQKDCEYPFEGLSGCGVGFKIIQAIAIKININLNQIYKYLDLVVVSIASDIVPMIDENRILSYYGLQILQSNPRPGLQALKEIIGLSHNISISNIVFGIGPRINAAGRIEHAKIAVELLLSKTIEDAYNIAYKLNEKNDIRKSIDNEITSEALEMIEVDLQNCKSTVLYKENWHKGVLGIVASRCIEKYYRPTVILTYSDNKATGSVRSVDGYNVYNAVEACKEYLEKYGGHAYAAGLTLDINNIDKFKTKFEEFVKSTIDIELLIPTQKIDIKINFSDINFKMLNVINQMSPFGPLNMSPTFMTENLIARGYKVLKEKHLKIEVLDLKTNVKFNAIGFNMIDLKDLITDNNIFKMVYKIEENIFNRNKYINLIIKDIKLM